MAQLVAEEMGFGQGWNSPSHTMTPKFDRKLTLAQKEAFSVTSWSKDCSQQSKTNKKDEEKIK